MKKGWKVKKLGEVCQIIGGGTPSKARSDFYDGDIPWATVRDMKEDFLTQTECKITEEGLKNSSSNLIPKNNVVIATRVGLGKICLLQQDTAINQDLKGIIPLSSNKLSVNYLYWWFKSISKVIIENGKGATVQGVNVDFVKNLEIIIPPISEQQEIVRIIDEAFDGINTIKANTEKNLQNARELFESYLNKIFVDQGRKSQSKKLESLCDLIVDCEHKTAPTQDTGFPSIRTPNIGRGELILEGVYRVSETTYQQWTKRAIPKSGDLILAREAPAGNVAIIPENLKVCLGQRTVLIRPSTNIFISKFLMYLLLSQNMQNILLSHSRGATVTHINMKDIRNLPIDFFPSISEQEIIVKKLDQLSAQTKRLEKIYQQKLTDLEELKKSILQKAFNGELT